MSNYKEISMGYCKKHDYVYTLPTWKRKAEPVYDCRYCKREGLNAFYEEFNNSFKDGNKYV